MQPEEKLIRESAIARSQTQNQKYQQYKSIADTNATIIGYNAATGQNVIRLANGSITYASSDTNGTQEFGESAPLNSSSMAIDGLPNIKREAIKTKKFVPIATNSVKVLFSVYNQETGSTDFYIGGDRNNPTLIYTSNPNDNILYARITNTGKKLTDWVVTIKYENTQSSFTENFVIVTSIGNYEVSNYYATDYAINRGQAPYHKNLSYCGNGFLSNGRAEEFLKSLVRQEDHEVKGYIGRGETEPPLLIDEVHIHRQENGVTVLDTRIPGSFVYTLTFYIYKLYESYYQPNNAFSGSGEYLFDIVPASNNGEIRTTADTGLNQYIRQRATTNITKTFAFFSIDSAWQEYENTITENTNFRELISTINFSDLFNYTFRITRRLYYLYEENVVYSTYVHPKVIKGLAEIYTSLQPDPDIFNDSERPRRTSTEYRENYPIITLSTNQQKTLVNKTTESSEYGYNTSNFYTYNESHNLLTVDSNGTETVITTTPDWDYQFLKNGNYIEEKNSLLYIDVTNPEFILSKNKTIKFADIFAFNLSNNQMVLTKKQEKIYNLKNPECTINDASVFI